MKSVKPIFFHSTTEKSLEQILKSGFIKKSGGRYGNAVYTASTIEESLEKGKGNVVLGIKVYGFEKNMVMPLNKVFKWGLFIEDIPLDFVKYVIFFDKDYNKISLEEDDKYNIQKIYAPQPNEVLAHFYYNKITNLIFNDFEKNNKLKPRLNKIKVTKPYSIEIDENTPTLEEFLKNKENCYPEFFNTKSWQNYSKTQYPIKYGF